MSSVAVVGVDVRCNITYSTPTRRALFNILALFFCVFHNGRKLQFSRKWLKLAIPIKRMNTSCKEGPIKDALFAEQKGVNA
jgi:hypothetical protein